MNVLMKFAVHTPRRRGRLAVLAVAFLMITALERAAGQPTLAWVRQSGASGFDASYGVSADGLGNVYISGGTGTGVGSADGRCCADAFVSKYDASGALLWTRQLGTRSSDEVSFGVSADGLGNVYISGETRGSLGGPAAGGSDVFVSKYDASGALLWSRQLGTKDAEENYGVSADGLGNVYISGGTFGSLGGPLAGISDAFVSKYDASGAQLWTRQLGTSGPSYDVSRGVSADGLGNVYISGDIGGDAFVSKYDASGVLLWTRQPGISGVGRSYGVSFGVSADGQGNVYISGDIPGATAADSDAFVSKYDASGALLWTRQLGTSRADGSRSVSADGLGNAYISGRTGGSLGGPSAGGFDSFVSKYDASGALLWTRQLGTSGFDSSYGVSADGLGNVYISGWTSGSLGGPSAGGPDAFVAKFTEIPEPASGAMAWTGATILLLAVAPRRRHASRSGLDARRRARS